MTIEEAIAWCYRFNNAWANADPEDDFPDVKYSDALDQLFYLAGKALRQQDVPDKDAVHNSPLTLDELREMYGEPVWIHFIGGAVIRNDGWFIVSQIGTSAIFLSGKVSVYKNFWYYGETWLAYRQKPEEGTI